MRIARLAVAICVIVGLLLAGRSAVRQWNGQQAAIDRQIETMASDPSLTPQNRIDQAARIESTRPSLSNIRWPLIAAAALVYAIGLVPPAMLLDRSLRCLGETPSRTTCVAAQLIGHVGKYVPGKAMVVVIRASVLARDGVGSIPASISIFLETFLMMAVGGVVAALITISLPVPTWIIASAVAVACLAGTPTLPPVLRLVASKVAKVDSEQIASAIGPRLFIAGWAWSLLSWILIGGSFTLVVAAIPSARSLPGTAQLYAVSTAAISLAVVVGFASLLPGGAGVRELVLTTIMASATGTTTALVAAIMARGVFLVVEVAVAGFCWAWLAQPPHRSHGGARDPI